MIQYTLSPPYSTLWKPLGSRLWSHYNMTDNYVDVGDSHIYGTHIYTVRTDCWDVAASSLAPLECLYSHEGRERPLSSVTHNRESKVRSKQLVDFTEHALHHCILVECIGNGPSHLLHIDGRTMQLANTVLMAPGKMQNKRWGEQQANVWKGNIKC